MAWKTGFLMVSLSMLLVPTMAHAHVSVVSGPGFANSTQEITFGVAHGCAGADTYRVRVEIPSSVISVRPETSGFGKTSVEKDPAGTVTAVVWQKADQDLLVADLEYYKLTMRVKVPNAPFTTVYFPAHQTCKAADGTVSTVDWIGRAADAPPAGSDAGADEPAPVLSVLPPRSPGWNKFTVDAAVSDLGALFSDALIVWSGSAAYSANPTTAELIASTTGVSPLTALSAGDVVWVKY